MLINYLRYYCGRMTCKLLYHIYNKEAFWSVVLLVHTVLCRKTMCQQLPAR